MIENKSPTQNLIQDRADISDLLWDLRLWTELNEKLIINFICISIIEKMAFSKLDSRSTLNQDDHIPILFACRQFHVLPMF